LDFGFSGLDLDFGLVFQDLVWFFLDWIDVGFSRIIGVNSVKMHRKFM